MQLNLNLTLPDNEEFQNLIKAYENAKINLQNYLWKETIINVIGEKGESVSGN